MSMGLRDKLRMFAGGLLLAFMATFPLFPLAAAPDAGAMPGTGLVKVPALLPVPMPDVAPHAAASSHHPLPQFPRIASWPAASSPQSQV